MKPTVTIETPRTLTIKSGRRAWIISDEMSMKSDPKPMAQMPMGSARQDAEVLLGGGVRGEELSISRPCLSLSPLRVKCTAFYEWCPTRRFSLLGPSAVARELESAIARPPFSELAICVVKNPVAKLVGPSSPGARQERPWIAHKYIVEEVAKALPTTPPEGFNSSPNAETFCSEISHRENAVWIGW
jgi:hypothetical protein